MTTPPKSTWPPRVWLPKMASGFVQRAGTTARVYAENRDDKNDLEYISLAEANHITERKALEARAEAYASAAKALEQWFGNPTIALNWFIEKAAALRKQVEEMG